MKCWTGYLKTGTHEGRNGKQVNTCVKCKHTKHPKGIRKK